MKIQINFETLDGLRCLEPFDISEEDFKAHKLPVIIERAMFGPSNQGWKGPGNQSNPQIGAGGFRLKTRRYRLVDRGEQIWYREE